MRGPGQLAVTTVSTVSLRTVPLQNYFDTEVSHNCCRFGMIYQMLNFCICQLTPLINDDVCTSIISFVQSYC